MTIEEAQRTILREIHKLSSEEVSLLQSLGRVIDEDVHAPWNIPAADNSAMDGYAFSHATLTGNVLKVIGFLPAGESRSVPVQPGEAIKIMTGAPIPPGCDTVVPVEDVREEGDTIRLIGGARAGDHVRRRGEDVREGDCVISSGSVLRPQEIGMLISLGRTTVPVIRRARVAILATGDELLEPGVPPEPGKLINSNSHSQASQVIDAGAEPVLIGIAPDNLEATREKILTGLQADILITTGGVSVGARDFVKDAILALGGEVRFWKVNMKPGKPVAFAVVDSKPVLALPGNPVAAMVAFEMFVRPALLRMMGHTRLFRPVVRAVLDQPVANKGKRPHLVRSNVQLLEGRYRAAATGSQSSARISSLIRGNGLMRLGPDSAYPEGEEVEVMLLDRNFEMGEFIDGDS